MSKKFQLDFYHGKMLTITNMGVKGLISAYRLHLSVRKAKTGTKYRSWKHKPWRMSLTGLLSAPHSATFLN